jgi:hypothetical protein
MSGRPRYYRMMRDRRPVGFHLRPSGELHLGETVEGLLERYRRPDRLSRANAVYLAETPEFASLGIPYAQGFVHVVEAEGEVQRRDQSWLRELQFRHHRNRQLIGRLSPRIMLARREFEEMSDQELCESYSSGRQSSRPTVEVVASGGIVVGHQSQEPTRVRRPGILSLLDE